MVQSLQPNGCEFESTCVFFYLFFDSFKFIIIDVPRPLSNEIWIILFQMVDG